MRSADDFNGYLLCPVTKRKKKYIYIRSSIGTISILILRASGAASSTVAKKWTARVVLSWYPFISVHVDVTSTVTPPLYYRTGPSWKLHVLSQQPQARRTVYRTLVRRSTIISSGSSSVTNAPQTRSIHGRRKREREWKLKGKGARRGLDEGRGLEGKRNLHAWRYIVPSPAPCKIPKQTPLFREYRRRCASRETTIPAHVSSCPRPAL